MGFRDYSPGLNRFLTRDMYNGALADLHLGSNPWTMSRYTFAGGNPTSLVEYDGHIAAIDSGGGGGGGVPAPTCTDATPEYCHAPGENTLNPYQLGLEWLGVEIASAYYTALACDWRPCLDSSKPVRTEYFRDGDPLTEGIRSHEWMNTVRARIEKALDEDRAFGTADFHYGDPELFSAEDRKDILWNNIDSVFTFGLRGMPIEQAFMGSYDLEWEVIGERGDDVVIEFNLTNASTYNSAKPDPAKVNAKAYGNNSAGNGQDAFAGELWTRQSVRWRETFTSGNAPKGPGTWHPRPGPWAKPSVILKPIWDLFH
jgi:hypothetical protein